MATSAERLSDALTRHAIELERLKTGTARKIVTLLRASDSAMAAALAERLEVWGSTGRMDSRRKAKSLQNLIDRTVGERSPIWAQIRQAVGADLARIASLENVFHAEALEESIGLEEVSIAVLTAGAVRATVNRTTVRGARVIEHLRSIERQERETLRTAIMLGATEGQKGADIVRGLRGSRSFGFKDGGLQPVRRNLGTIVSTGIIALSNAVQGELYDAAGQVAGMKWVSVLDGRTTLICQTRDGHGTAFPGKEKQFPDSIPALDPPGALPPAHFNCRSHMEAVLDNTAVVKPHRTFVTSTIPDPHKRIHFRRLAQRNAGTRWAGLSERQRRRLIRNEQNDWAETNIGTTAPDTTYPVWLGRQSAAFQDSVLGKTRGALFRRGDLPVDRFVDFAGKPFTLEQLKQRNPDAFRRAGIE